MANADHNEWLLEQKERLERERKARLASLSDPERKKEDEIARATSVPEEDEDEEEEESEEEKDEKFTEATDDDEYFL